VIPTHPGWRIVQAKPSDFAPLARVAQEGDQPWDEHAFRHAYNHRNQRLWIATNGLTPLGYCILSIVADEGEIQSIAVAKTHHRKGIGTALMSHVLKSPGISQFFLDVRAGNEAAKMLYEHHGFVEIDRRHRYYGDGEDAILMGATVVAEDVDT
jgi:ribosomal-protein-alanine acetyltransferase